MMWLAHSGEEHVTNSESLLHVLTTDFLKFFVITAVFISIIILLAVASQPKKSPKPKEESNE